MSRWTKEEQEARCHAIQHELDGIRVRHGIKGIIAVCFIPEPGESGAVHQVITPAGLLPIEPGRSLSDLLRAVADAMDAYGETQPLLRAN